MQGGSGWNHDVHHELLLCMLPSESERRGDKMIGSHTPVSTAERKRVARLEIAHRLYQALVAQDPDRLITLRDGDGRVVARHDPRPEEGELGRELTKRAAITLLTRAG
jgi:hypothetical protein